MHPHSIIAKILGVTALLLIAGCAQLQLVAEAVKRTQPGQSLASRDIDIRQLDLDLSPETSTSLGKFKVGNPYKIKGKWYKPSDYPQYSETGIASWYGPQFHKRRTANGAIFDMNKVSAAHKTLPLPSLVLVTNLENNKTMKIMVNDRGPYASARIIDLSKRAAQLLGFVNQGLVKVRVELLREESLALQGKLGRKTTAAFANNTKSQKIQFTNNQIARAKPVQSVLQAQQVARSNKISIAPPKAARQSPVASKLFGLIDPASGSAMTSVSVLCCDGRVISNNPVATRNIGSENAYFVQLGAFSSLDAAQNLRKKIMNIGNVEMTPIVYNQRTLYRVRVGPYNDIRISQQKLGQILNSGFPEAQIVLAKR